MQQSDMKAATVLETVQPQLIQVHQLYISPGHNYFGRHGREAGKNPILQVSRIECIAGRGIRGDRFFDYKENYKGQITFFSRDIYEKICREFAIYHLSTAVFRRNVITLGADLNALAGRDFWVQGVQFRGTEECHPCYWMDEAFAPGACDFLKGRGGLRARILSSGILSVSEV